MPKHIERARQSVVTVGEGRGFILRGRTDDLEFFPVIVTAAHCLPHLPSAHGLRFDHEKRYPNLLGPLTDDPSKAPKTISAECIFVDPVADIAVLGSPDSQLFWDQSEAYQSFTREALGLRISNARERSGSWILTLDRRWDRGTAEHFGSWISVFDAGGPFEGGMSGSPILDPKGAAIAVFCSSSGKLDEPDTESGLNPTLTENLPGWLLRHVYSGVS